MNSFTEEGVFFFILSHVYGSHLAEHETHHDQKQLCKIYLSSSKSGVLFCLDTEVHLKKFLLAYLEQMLLYMFFIPVQAMKYWTSTAVSYTH